MSLRSTLASLSLLVSSVVCVAQDHIDSPVDIPFNRMYDYDETTEWLQKLANAYPNLLRLESLGQSEQGREMWLVTMNNTATGPDTEKPAMWIDGNVHGNEVQASETVLYSIWYLAKSHGKVDQLTEMIDRVAFYFVPMVNPDGRAKWFAEPNTSSSQRSGQRPTDNDYDGLFDEDGPEDLDGDGHITSMWRFDPNGTYRRSEKDPRIFERVEPGEKGEFSRAGSEGIDNDGDGQINEDGPGGYDMNRNWPSDWQPNYVQFGAGDYPFDRPETRCIGMFILDHPNIAAGQSYHNTGGMMLRGPGTQYLENRYDRADRMVYEKLGEAGEEMLPYYNYYVLYEDLYTVHGGFVTWPHEGIGALSFTNELWTDAKRLQGESQRMDQEARMRWQDRMVFGQTFTDYTEYDHPTYGKVLIGGGTKFSSRVPPNFMLEEECHRNFAFTMFHADNMPNVSFGWSGVRRLNGNLWEVTIEMENDKLIPSVLGIAASKKIGQPDRVTISGPGISVVTSGIVNDRSDKTINDPTKARKQTITLDSGIPSQGRRTIRYLLTGAPQTELTLSYTSDKARNVTTTVTLK